MPSPSRTAPLPTRRSATSYRRTILALTSLGLAGLVAGLLSGCSNISQASQPGGTSAESYTGLTGNWRFASGAKTGSVELAGALNAVDSQVSGHLHTLAGSCASSSGVAFPVSGAIDADGHVVVSGQDADHRVFAISGLIATNQQSLITPTITVTGTCTSTAEARSLHANDDGGSTGQQYQAVTGNYVGSFIDGGGDSLAVSATLSQPTTPDADGVYHLTGSATFASAPCIGSPVVTSSTVTGDQISATYTDPDSGATVTGSGTFSADAQTLTIDSWTLSGNCGADSGSGVLHQQ